MHEAGLARTALEIAESRARGRGANRIHRLTLRVGDLSGVAVDALRFALESLCPGTLAAESEFDIEVVPVECYCAPCASLFRPDDVIYACPQCGRISGDVRQGQELEFVAVEVS